MSVTPAKAGAQTRCAFSVKCRAWLFSNQSPVRMGPGLRRGDGFEHLIISVDQRVDRLRQFNVAVRKPARVMRGQHDIDAVPHI